jgi:hypothetical protein
VQLIDRLPREVGGARIGVRGIKNLGSKQKKKPSSLGKPLGAWWYCWGFVFGGGWEGIEKKEVGSEDKQDNNTTTTNRSQLK